MALDYTLDRQRALLISRACGELTGDEIAEHCRRVLEEERLEPPFRHLVDLRAVTAIGDVPGDVPRRVWAPGSARGVRRAFVSLGGAVYGLARQHAAYAELAGAETAVFTTVREPKRGLGYSPARRGPARRRQALRGRRDRPPLGRRPNVGCMNAVGPRWRLSGSEAIAGTNAGKWASYVTRNGRALEMIIARVSSVMST